MWVANTLAYFAQPLGTKGKTFYKIDTRWRERRATTACSGSSMESGLRTWTPCSQFCPCRRSETRHQKHKTFFVPVDSCYLSHQNFIISQLMPLANKQVFVLWQRSFTVYSLRLTPGDRPWGNQNSGIVWRYSQTIGKSEQIFLRVNRGVLTEGEGSAQLTWLC